MTEHIPREQMVAFLHGALAPAESQLLEAHCQRCDECRAGLESYRAVFGALAALPATEPSPDFKRRFWQRFEAELRPSLGARLAAALLRPRYAVASGALAVVVALGVILLAGRPDKPSAEELAIAENLELYADFEVIQQLDVLEGLEAIEGAETGR